MAVYNYFTFYNNFNYLKIRYKNHKLFLEIK